ncbi:MAG: HEAT repeat domain-containing protein [Polyangiaceae bacterium]|nr:HEAT repeat domain-containing protein [Polyangiaceae bacterium]
MFGYKQARRTLEAAERDSLSASRDLVKIEAVRELGRYAEVGEEGESEAVQRRAAEVLIERLTHPVPAVRGETALALADARVVSAISALKNAAGDENLRVRQMVLVALGELASSGDRAVTKLLTQASRAEEPELRFQALIGLARVAPDDDAALSRGLADEDSEVRYIALRLAEERYGVEEAPEAMLARARRALADSAHTVRVAAAHWLARRGEEPAREQLAWALNARGGTSRVKLSAEDEIAMVELAGQLEVKAAAPGLERRAFGLLRTPATWHARVALARLGDARAVEALMRGLSAWTFDARTQAVAAVGQARLKAARPRLEAMRKSGLADEAALDEALAALDER